MNEFVSLHVGYPSGKQEGISFFVTKGEAAVDHYGFTLGSLNLTTSDFCNDWVNPLQPFCMTHRVCPFIAYPYEKTIDNRFRAGIKTAKK